ncbi:unnamed protein product [Hydatigera taeniaeformis]|uniref:Amino acid transporter n=1 Tax=Hydatigena taeniaeformis TaxID=6205 RepID=A0A0R3WSQ4_HYDTA|nr:unnamed protein product [Hydatigera taeniaeformis]
MYFIQFHSGKAHSLYSTTCFYLLKRLHGESDCSQALRRKLVSMMDTYTHGASFSMEREEATKCATKFKKGLKDNLFTILTLIGVVIGFGIGFGVGTIHPSETVVTWIAMPGKIYIRLLQLTILPVIASNIIVVMGKIDPRENGKMGLAALLFILGFDIISGAIGVIVAVLIKPGLSTSISVNVTVEEPGPDDAPVSTSDVFADLLLLVSTLTKFYAMLL